MQRRLLVLRDRIDELADYLCKHSDHKHADLSYEMTYANATADIAAEFVAELGSENIGTEPPKQTPDRSTPQIGTGVQQMTIDA